MVVQLWVPPTVAFRTAVVRIADELKKQQNTEIIVENISDVPCFLYMFFDEQK